MKSVSECYAVLGLHASATDDDIKKAYKRLAFKWHPDKNPRRKEEAKRRFKEVAHAYQVLTNRNSRASHGASDFDFKSADDLFHEFFGDQTIDEALESIINAPRASTLCCSALTTGYALEESASLLLLLRAVFTSRGYETVPTSKRAPPPRPRPRSLAPTWKKILEWCLLPAKRIDQRLNWLWPSFVPYCVRISITFMLLVAGVIIELYWISTWAYDEATSEVMDYFTIGLIAAPPAMATAAVTRFHSLLLCLITSLATLLKRVQVCCCCCVQCSHVEAMRPCRPARELPLPDHDPAFANVIANGASRRGALFSQFSTSLHRNQLAEEDTGSKAKEDVETGGGWYTVDVSSAQTFLYKRVED